MFSPLAEVQYQRLQRLGEGGMGVVERVRDRRLGREAALKVLRDPEQADFVARFHREARLTARLVHPSIISILESGTLKTGQPFMLMPVVEGKTLRELIRSEHKHKDGPPNWRVLLNVFMKVVEAMCHAHERGVIHRDLKPENVMVGPHGEVVVMDWGLAREVEDTPEANKDGEIATIVMTPEQLVEAESGELTMPGTVMGTPGYMPPRQAQGLPVKKPADVFALGAILHDILVGKPPVKGKNNKDRLLETIRARVTRPRDLNPQVPKELDALAARALAIEPEDRIKVDAFARDLRSYIYGADPTAETVIQDHTPSAVAEVVEQAKLKPAETKEYEVKAPEQRQSTKLSPVLLGACAAVGLVLGLGLGFAAFAGGSQAKAADTKELAKLRSERAEAESKLTRFKEDQAKLTRQLNKLKAQIKDQSAGPDSANPDSANPGSANPDSTNPGSAGLGEVHALMDAVTKLQVKSMRGYHGTRLEGNLSQLAKVPTGKRSKDLLLALQQWQSGLKDEAFASLQRASQSEAYWSAYFLHVFQAADKKRPWDFQTKAGDYIVKRGQTKKQSNDFTALFGAYARLRENQPKQALALLKAAKGKTLGDEILVARAKVQLVLQAPDAAIADITKAAQALTQEPYVFFLKAQISELKSNMAGADKDASRALELDPNYSPARVLRARVRAKLGRIAEAWCDCESLSRGDAHSYLDAEARLAWLGLYAELSARLENYDTALERVNEGLKLSSSDVQLQTLRAAILGQRGEYKKAERAFTVVLRRKQQIKALYGRALCYYCQGKYQAALKDLNACARSKFLTRLKADQLFFHRGLVHKALKLEDEAEKDFQRALRLNEELKKRPRDGSWFSFQGLWRS